jgi:Holliday junction resolvase RusA-like endonuclease
MHMQFRLHYRGPLHANADAARKHAIRKVFHPQLATLWDSPALSIIREKEWTMPGGYELWLRIRGKSRFIPLVRASSGNVVELHITWLRPGPLGSLVNGSGDIDNRLKTLFDAMRVPNVELQNGEDSLQPTYCLLDDDALITDVRITTDRLLEVEVHEMHVEMIIAVSIRPGAASLPQTFHFQY